jgi:hypothetical protein
MSSHCRERTLVKVLACVAMLGACALAAQSHAQGRTFPDP